MSDYEKKQMLDAFLKNYHEIRKKFVREYDSQKPELLAEDIIEFTTLFDTTTKNTEELQIYDVIFGIVNMNRWFLEVVNDDFAKALFDQHRTFSKSTNSAECQLANKYSYFLKTSEHITPQSRYGRTIKKPKRFSASRN